MAQAGFLSFLAGTEASAQEPVHTFPHSGTALLAAAINSDPNPSKGSTDIKIDDSALIPAVTPEGLLIIEGLSTQAGKSVSVSRYIVHKGDTVVAIAKMFGVSVNTIRWTNDLSTGSILREGQELLILPITGIRYTVKKGDTISSIAKKFKADSEEIISYNDLNSLSKLSTGMIVIVPDGVEPTAPTTPRTASNPWIARDSGPEVSGYYLRPLSWVCPHTQGLHGHNGIDLGCPTGTPVMAAAAGEVTIARGGGAWNGGYGNMVVITHGNGTQTLYSHMSEVDVVAGQTVGQGERIGAVGRTGKVTGSHLHFEVRGAKNPF